MGIVYLIQPEEYLETNIYKVGRSDNQSLRRIKSYGKRTEIVSIMCVSDCKSIEKIILDKFKSVFPIVKGREYFDIDLPLGELLKAFVNLVIENNDKYVKQESNDFWKDEPIEYGPNTFRSGKHKGKSFEEVKLNTNYFYYLIAQPVGTVIEYLDFINYCKEQEKISFKK